MKKQRLVLASVLKPINDTRMYEKFGLTLAAQTDFEIHIIGYPAKEKIIHPSITFHPLSSFARISWKRLFAPLQVILKVHQVKPEVLIITTHELLIVSFINRILFGTKILYDVQENYYRNIRYSEAFPGIIRPFLATWVRLKEYLFAPFVHQYFLAEKGYEKELSFPRNRYIVLENKCQFVVPKTSVNQDKIRLIFSGTLSEVTGVFRAIRLAKMLHALESKIELRIIGYTPVSEVYHQIKNEIFGHPYISLKGGNELVPHQEILEEIAGSHFGLISYLLLPHIQNSIPTKLYEYLNHQLPILLQQHPSWEELCLPYPAAIVVDYSDPDAQTILAQMKAKVFYREAPQDVSWQSEEPKLLRAIQSLF